MTDHLANKLFVQIYSKLAATLSVPEIVGQDESSILSLQIPGLYIRPHLDINDPATQYYVANALNAVVACGWKVVKKAGTVSDVYKSILDGKETPLVQLSAEQRKELDQASAYLFDEDDKPTKAYQDYLAYQLVYFEALDNYEAAAATQKNGGVKIPNKLVKKLETSKQAWHKEGHKADVERSIATVAQYESLEPATFWKRLAERYSQYTFQAGDTSEFQYVTSNPPYNLWFQEFGWSDFQFNITDFKNQNRSGGVGVDNCCCCGYDFAEKLVTSSLLGPFSILSSDSSDENVVISAPQDFYLSCRLRRIEIIRPWMDTNVFYSRAWRWSPASVFYGVKICSGGDIAGRVLPTGVMPVLPMTAILARDVNIYWNDTKTIQTVKRHLEQSHEIHLGPFRLSRAIIQDEHNISEPDPQLIGFISTILPKCPDPDPTLPWPLFNAKRNEWP